MPGPELPPIGDGAAVIEQARAVELPPHTLLRK